jgi:hypothetical protein
LAGKLIFSFPSVRREGKGIGKKRSYDFLERARKMGKKKEIRIRKESKA